MGICTTQYMYLSFQLICTTEHILIITHVIDTLLCLSTLHTSFGTLQMLYTTVKACYKVIPKSPHSTIQHPHGIRRFRRGHKKTGIESKHNTLILCPVYI